MTEPLIMAWTVLPFRIVAKAWRDNTFLQELTDNTNAVLRNALWELPWSNNYILSKESGNQRYLVLPELPRAYVAWTEEQVLNQIIAETFGDVSLQYYLPARVINKAFFDSSYRTQLLSNADSALSSMGTAPRGGETFTVLENSGNNMNFVLPEIPLEWEGLTYNELLQRLFFQSNQLVSNFSQ